MSTNRDLVNLQAERLVQEIRAGDRAGKQMPVVRYDEDNQAWRDTRYIKKGQLYTVTAEWPDGSTQEMPVLGLDEKHAHRIATIVMFNEFPTMGTIASIVEQPMARWR